MKAITAKTIYHQIISEQGKKWINKINALEWVISMEIHSESKRRHGVRIALTIFAWVITALALFVWTVFTSIGLINGPLMGGLIAIPSILSTLCVVLVILGIPKDSPTVNGSRLIIAGALTLLIFGMELVVEAQNWGYGSAMVVVYGLIPAVGVDMAGAAWLCHSWVKRRSLAALIIGIVVPAFLLIMMGF